MYVVHMDLKEFATDARDLMNAHGLHHVPMEFDRGRKRMGACYVQTTVVAGRKLHNIQKITFSSQYVPLLEWEELRGIVLHEIAHALAPGDNHGAEFMRMCRHIGAKPARCHAPTARPEFTVTAFCPECGVQRAGQFRLPTRAYVCRTCRVGSDKVILVWYRKGIRVRFEDMPSDYQARVNYFNSRRK